MAAEEKPKEEEKKEETKAPEPEKKAEEKPQKEKATKKASPKLEKMVDQISQLSALELSELVSSLEEKLGVSAAAPATAAAPTPPAGGAAEGAQAGEVGQQATFNVVLANAGANKISVIKAVREIDQTLGLKNAKDLVEAAPKEVLTGANKETAEEAKKKLEAAGATVELK